MLFFEKIKQIIFNEKIKSSKQVETDVSLKTIIEIPLKDNTKSAEIISCDEKNASFKAFKKMVTNIQFLCVNNVLDKKVILVTSAENETGKSYVTANLGIAFSRIGKKVLIIDADMINGRQDKIFNIPNNLGLSNYLSNLDSNGLEINEFLSKFINETAIKNVNLITSGTVPPNPAELLASAKLPELIKDAKVFFDVILIDSNEVLNRTEALVLARNTNSTIIVAEPRKTSVEELQNAKKDIQNVGGKILGVVLNKIKLPKEKKTKEQKKEEFSKFRLKIKEKIDTVISLLKTKLDKANQKLLEEPKRQDVKKQEVITESKIEEVKNEYESVHIKIANEKIVDAKSNNAELVNAKIIDAEPIDVRTNNVDQTNTKIIDNQTINIIRNEVKVATPQIIDEKNKIENNIISENSFNSQVEIKKDENNSAKVSFMEMLKNIKLPEKKGTNLIYEEAIEKKIEESKIEKASEKIINFEKQQIIEITNNEKQISEKEISQQSEYKEEVADKEKIINSTKFLEAKNAIIEKFGIVKNKLNEKINLVKENKKAKNEKTENENAENKNSENENAENKNSENEKKITLEKTKEKIVETAGKVKTFCVDKIDSLKNISKKSENTIINQENEDAKDSEENRKTENKKEILDSSIKNEDMILIIVDAENGYCRVFSKDYFVEKLIRGLDKSTGCTKAHYSMRNLRRKKQYFMERYQLTEQQSNRIDVLIYDALKDYDEYQWVERKVPSDKAETYALVISKEFDKEPEENGKEYNTRCQRLRKAELEKAELDIEYKLDNLWMTTKINMSDKFLLNKFAKIYEIETNMKNDSEIMKSKKAKKFYADVIKGAEKRFEKAKNEDIKKEESEKKVIEEDRKIKQEELKFEQQQLELEKKAAQERIRIEQENVKAEKKAEQERIKEEKRKEREIERIEKKEENIRKKKEKQKQKEDAKFQKERERLKQMEEAKLEEELLEDNLYPKTKHNKNL